MNNVLIQKRPNIMLEYDSDKLKFEFDPVKYRGEDIYTTDRYFTGSQRWLINARQGDQNNRIPERNNRDIQLAEKEKDNMDGFSMLNDGFVESILDTED